MTPFGTSTENLRSKVMELLQQEQITTVALVDDAYQTPGYSDIADGLDALVDDLNHDERAQELANLLDLPDSEVVEASSFEDVHIALMWKKCTGAERGELLDELRNRVFREQLDNWEPVDFIRRTLESLGLEVRTLAPEVDDLGQGADIWMFDLFWERVETSSSSTSTSWHRTAEFARWQFKRGRPPLFVLMSSHGKTLEKRRMAFRTKAELPAGSFSIWHKRVGASEADTHALLNWLASLLEAVPFRKRVFQLVQAVEDAADDALKQYKSSLRALAPEDYAHIYRYSLEEEGHPLGDYVLWLVEPLFEFHLRQATGVRERRAELDRLVGQDVPLYDCLEREPSAGLGQIHQLRIWQRIGKPLRSNLKHDIPRLHQGDLLVSKQDSADVFLVLNADCDLAFAEFGEKRTTPRSNLSVFLLPGTLEPFGIETRTRGQIEFTDFHAFDESSGKSRAHRIRWRLGEAATRTYSDISADDFQRHWRLRRPFLSRLVQKWSHHVTRVGTPVSPPMIERLYITRIYQRAENGPGWDEGELPDGPHEAYLFSRMDAEGRKSSKLVVRDRDRLQSALAQSVVGQTTSVLETVASRLHTARDLEVIDETRRAKLGKKTVLCLYDVAFEQLRENKNIQLILLAETPEIIRS